MQIEYDHETDTLYLRLDASAKREFDTRVLEDDGIFAVFDIDEHDRIAGIEILNASRCVNLGAILPIEGARAAS